jgi:hypothetical protein
METRARTGSGARAQDPGAPSARAPSKTSVVSEEPFNVELRRSDSVTKKLADLRTNLTEKNPNKTEAAEGSEAAEPRRKKSSVSQLIAKFENQTDQVSVLLNLLARRQVSGATL